MATVADAKYRIERIRSLGSSYSFAWQRDVHAESKRRLSHLERLISGKRDDERLSPEAQDVYESVSVDEIDD